MIRGRLIAGGLAGSLALAVLPAGAPAAPRGFFGVMPQGPLSADDYAGMGAAGVGTLRLQLSWAAIDAGPAAGGYDWSDADAVVAGAARNRIRALPVVTGTPAWVIALDGRRCGRRGCPPFAPTGSAALAAWRAFLTAAVDRYGPAGAFWADNPSLPQLPVRVWQVWNEQNSPSYWEPRPDVDAYARLLDAAHEAITQRDPEAKLILGGMFATPLGGLGPAITAARFLARLYRHRGARRDFDGVAAHPYAAKLSGVREQINLLRDRMDAAGDERAGLWITELGWASGGAPNPLNRGLDGQASRLRQAFAYLLRKRRALRIENVTWYSWRDDPGVLAGRCAWCPDSGLLNADGTAKPSLGVFAEFAHAD
ncbi:MAG: polysaccharide biosynthesis protein PslG [Solirubrobacterales bacterium]|nr:polysaccharide biosynthesis protein PslG [Solirubrobacterales bacterium]